MEHHKITLDSKPDAELSVSTYCPDKDVKTLVLFLNGLMLPQASWKPAIEILLQDRQLAAPAIITYDRFGQGKSEPDPSDPPDTPYGHNAAAIIDDLHQLLVQVCSQVLHFSLPGPDNDTRLVIVGNSIGCPLARLYAAAHPGTVSGFLFLDSMIANTDFVTLIPDPDSPAFDETALPDGVSVEDIRQARARVQKLFHPTVPNRERFDRRDMAERLPFADQPTLPAGPDGKAPLLVVAGHDRDTFANESLEGSLAMPKPVTKAFVQPHWEAYNEGLSRLTGSNDRVSGPVMAPGCGHFIQRDNPRFVAKEIGSLLDRLEVGGLDVS